VDPLVPLGIWAYKKGREFAHEEKDDHWMKDNPWLDRGEQFVSCLDSLPDLQEEGYDHCYDKDHKNDDKDY